MALSCLWVPGGTSAQPRPAPVPITTPACVMVSNVDSCWQAGVAAAFAQYERSCAAGLTIYGCYEAGKIAFLDPGRRNYVLARARMTRVCESDDILMGPYACTYRGIMERDGLGGPRRVADSAFSFMTACFIHNRDHYIDGRGCALLADSLPDAKQMRVPEAAWPRDYVRFLAYTMGCTDQLPALCGKARAVWQRGVAMKASWLATCEDQLAGRPPAGTCALLADPAMSAKSDARQRFRGQIVALFRAATDIHDR